MGKAAWVRSYSGPRWRPTAFAKCSKMGTFRDASRRRKVGRAPIKSMRCGGPTVRRSPNKSTMGSIGYPVCQTSVKLRRPTFVHAGWLPIKFARSSQHLIVASRLSLSAPDKPQAGLWPWSLPRCHGAGNGGAACPPQTSGCARSLRLWRWRPGPPS